MTLAKAFVATDFANITTWTGFPTKANSKKIVIEDGFRKAVYEGSFKFDGSGNVSGTLNSLTEFAGGVKLRGFEKSSESIEKVFKAFDTGNFLNVAKIFLAKDDKVLGSDFDDNVLSFGGDDLVKGNGGNDTARTGGGNDIAYGGAGNDTLLMGPGSDKGYGGPGADLLKMGGGNDRAWGGNGADDIRGQQGKDRIEGEGGDDVISGGSKADVLLGGDDNDTISGDGGNDKIRGGSGSDTLNGGKGADDIRGGNGADIISGGNGKDFLFGGNGADIFELKSASESKVGAKFRDKIGDFQQGTDLFDVSAIDAGSAVGDQSFVFIGSSGFSGAEGELRYRKLSSSDKTILSGDIDGDGSADFQMEVSGAFDFMATDFVL